MYRLLFEDRRAPRAPFVARDPMIVIGRDPGCQLRLTEQGISERHAAIERRTDGYHLRDLGSAIGVRVNGAAVADQCLSSGDELEIGAVRMRFEFMHESFSSRRRVDTLQIVAGLVIAISFAGQLAVLGWIFSQPHSRDMRVESSRNKSNLAPSKAQPSAESVPPSRPTEPLSQSVTPSPPPAALDDPLAGVLNRMIRLARVDRADTTDNVTLTIQAKAQVGERELDATAVAIGVQFITAPAAGRAGVWTEPVWANVGPWENFTAKNFTVRFAGPPSQLAGYVVRSYYRNQLQDISATPPSLQATAPIPKR